MATTPTGTLASEVIPGYEAALGLFGIENSQEVPQVTMFRCAILERAEAAKKLGFS